MRPRKKPNLSPRLAACAAVIIDDALAAKRHLRESFENPSAPLHLEIGCGKGQFICELAARNPDINFIAMEREENVAVIATERAMHLGVRNVRFIIDDAELLPVLFSDGELSRVYINFCDPWHKHRQFKRRLTYRGRLLSYQKLLAPDGEVQFKTDNEPLYRFSRFEFAAAMPPYFTTEDLHDSQYAGENIMTEYESYFSSLGQPIYSIRAVARTRPRNITKEDFAMRRPFLFAFILCTGLVLASCGQTAALPPAVSSSESASSEAVPSEAVSSAMVSSEAAPVDLSDLEAVTQAYVTPIFTNSPGPLYYSWDDVSQIEPDHLFFIFCKNNYLDLPKDAEGVYLPAYWEQPAGKVEAAIKAHFDVTSEHLKKSQFYIPARDVYSLLGGFGGGYGPIATAASQSGTTITIEIAMLWSFDEREMFPGETKVPGGILTPEGTLTLEFAEGKPVRYRSFAVDERFLAVVNK